MKLIIGLGNPGKKYKNSKHNIGFMSLDSYAKINKIKFKKSIRFNSEIVKIDNIILLKPKTYMNNSGLAIRKVADYYNIDSKNILVIFDDLNIPFAKIRIRYNGTAGGHNGVKSIISHLNTQEFNRLRIGIGRNPDKDMKDEVLSDFSKAELKILSDLQISISSIIEDFVQETPIEIIMNKYNKK